MHLSLIGEPTLDFMARHESQARKTRFRFVPWSSAKPAMVTA